MKMKLFFIHADGTHLATWKDYNGVIPVPGDEVRLDRGGFYQDFKVQNRVFDESLKANDVCIKVK